VNTLHKMGWLCTPEGELRVVYAYLLGPDEPLWNMEMSPGKESASTHSLR
jgi:hypothetical protein